MCACVCVCVSCSVFFLSSVGFLLFLELPRLQAVACPSDTLCQPNTNALTAGHEACKLDVAPPELAGFLQGLSNTLAAFGGVVGVPLAAHLYERYHTWASVFGMLAVIYAAGAVTAILFARADRIAVTELLS